jgi:phage shock protein E
MLADYLLPGLALAYVAWRVLSSVRVKRRLPGLLKDGAQIVDVRSPAEFFAGHATGSVNVPLQDLEQGAKALDPKKMVIVCCASGTRSAMAGRKLRRLGFSRVLNAGSWRNVS